MGAASVGFEALEGVRRGQRRLGAIPTEGPHAGALVDLNSALALQLAEEDAGAPEAEADSQLPADALAFLRRWPDSFDAAKRALAFVQSAEERFDAPDIAAAGIVLDRRSIRWSAPVPQPGKVVGVRHEGATTTAQLFLKAPSSIAGPSDELRIPSGSQSVELHGELALVVGRRIHGVPPQRALECVAGYCVALALRPKNTAAALATLGWSGDGSAPLGPALVTADEISDPGNLALRLQLSGEPLAEGHTRDLALSVPELLALASRAMTLEPGDVVLTGSPLSWSADLLPRPLRDGDVVQFDVEGVGRLATYVQAKSN
jgi:acylpyruvate hydrolase